AAALAAADAEPAAGCSAPEAAAASVCAPSPVAAGTAAWASAAATTRNDATPRPGMGTAHITVTRSTIRSLRPGANTVSTSRCTGNGRPSASRTATPAPKPAGTCTVWYTTVSRAYGSG